MANITWAIICQRTIVDEQSKLTSLIDIVENLNVQFKEYKEEGAEWVVMPEQYTLATYYIRSELEAPEEAQIKVSVISPSKKVWENKVEFNVDLLEKERARVFINLQGIPFIESGIYWYAMEILEENKWIEKARVPISINQLKTKPTT